MSREVWTSRYATPPEKLPVYDGWLDRWESVFRDLVDGCVLDLGCGRGTDSSVLTGWGVRTVPTDFAERAVALVNDRIGARRGAVVDHSRDLPFPAATFPAVVADLTLHYFEDRVTRSILAEIRRVLRPGGLFLSRFNSIDDRNYGANPEARSRSAHVRGVHKQFFTEERLRDLFGETFSIEEIRSDLTNCYGRSKAVLEVVAR